MPETPTLHWDGRANAATGPVVLLAHGAGAGCESDFLVQAAQALADRGCCVARFDYPYMAARRTGIRRGPDPTAKLLACHRAAVAAATSATGAPSRRLVLAGKSMGGRMATMLADELQVAGVVAIGYPFHPPRRPDQLRTAHLTELRTPCLILQGERDPFGTFAEVAGYPLSPAITVQWFADGDHSLVPRKKSGHTEAAHFATAIAATAGFARRVTGVEPPSLDDGHAGRRPLS